jgi:nucleoside-diphosphate-sugar epimerase
MHVFLTGAAGFVGRHVAVALERRGHRVTGLDRAAGDEDSGLVRADMLDPDRYRAALAPADVVVHLAATTGKAPPPVYARTNVDGTRALLEASAAAGVSRFLFFSTIAVTFADTRRYAYAQSKMAAERLVATSGLKHVIVRPTIVAGPGSPVMAGFAKLARLPVIPAFAGARARVQPILVDDLAQYVVDIVEEGRFAGEVLELGGPEIVTLRELLDRFHRRLRGRAARFVYVPLGPVLPVLAALERIALAAVPVTVGQLATFRFDGVIQPSAVWEARRPRLATLDAMIAASVDK